MDPIYLRLLLRVQVARQRDDAAIGTASRLLALSPQDGQAHAVLAALLAGRDASESDLSGAEAHLRAAASDPGAAVTRQYARGLLALRRGQAAPAVCALARAVRADPSSDVALYQLGQAERLNGQEAAARRDIAAYHRRLREKQTEADLLKGIAARPDRLSGYAQAAAYYDAHGLRAQAMAIRAAAHQASRPQPNRETHQTETPRKQP
jgi:lipopolysaccharide biosynthesis regulator YciM